MTLTLPAVFVLIAIILFVLAAISVPNPPRLNWVAMGLACWAIAYFIIITGR